MNFPQAHRADGNTIQPCHRQGSRRHSLTCIYPPRGAHFSAVFGVWCLVFGVGLTGCAYTVQRVSTQSMSTNGLAEIRTTRSSAVAWGDSRQVIEKLKVSNGKTHTIGMEGTESSSSTTNIAANIQALTGLLQALRPTP